MVPRVCSPYISAFRAIAAVMTDFLRNRSLVEVVAPANSSDIPLRYILVMQQGR